MLTKPTEKRLIAIYRRMAWADYLRQDYYRELKGYEFRSVLEFLQLPIGMYLYFWYAALFTVIEGLLELEEKGRIKIPVLLLNRINGVKPSLEKHRNFVFHYRPDPWDKDMLRMFEPNKQYQIMGKLHDEIGNFLTSKLEHLK